MSLEGAQFICLDEAGNRGKVVVAKGRKFTVGYYVSCDFVLADERAKGEHCTIESDAFGRITIRNMSSEHPIIVNKHPVVNKINLFSKDVITILGQSYLWEFSSQSIKETEEKSTEEIATPQKQICIPEHSGFSSPGLKTRKAESRFTVHNFAYCIQSDEEGNTSTESNKKDEIDENVVAEEVNNSDAEQKLSNQGGREVTPEPESKIPTTTNVQDTPKLNMINCTNDKENTGSTQKKSHLQLSMCHQSDVVITSFSPRETGVKAEKSFTAILQPKVLVTMAPNTPKSVIGDDDDHGGDFNSGKDIQFHTPSTSKKGGFTTATKSARKNCSMHLVDYTTPNRLAPASPYLKSALKASAKKLPLTPSTGKDSKANVAAEKHLSASILPITPLVSDDNNSKMETPNSVQSIISVDSTDTSSVIEILSDESTSNSSHSVAKTPQKKVATRVQATTPMRTPQSLMKRALLTSAKKQVTTPQRTVEGAPATPRRGPINRIPLRTSIGALRSPVTPKHTGPDVQTVRRLSMSTPTRKIANPKFESTPASNTKFATPSPRKSLIPMSASKAITTSTPLGSSCSNRYAACKSTPLNKVRKSVAGVPLSSHISKVRKSIIAAAPSNYSSIKEKSPQQKMSDRLLSRARKSTGVSPMVAKAIHMVQAAKAAPSSIWRQSRKSMSFSSTSRPTLFTGIPKTDEGLGDRSRTFILDTEDGESYANKMKQKANLDEISKTKNVTLPTEDANSKQTNSETKDVISSPKKEKRFNITFSPEKEKSGDEEGRIPKMDEGEKAVETPLDVEELSLVVEQISDNKKVENVNEQESESVGIAEKSLAEISASSKRTDDRHIVSHIAGTIEKPSTSTNEEENANIAAELTKQEVSLPKPMEEVCEIGTNVSLTAQTSEESFAEVIADTQEDKLQEAGKISAETYPDALSEFNSESKDLEGSSEAEVGFGEESVIEKPEIVKQDETKPMSKSITEEPKTDEICGKETDNIISANLNLPEREAVHSSDILEQSTHVYKPICEDITLESSSIEKEITDSSVLDQLNSNIPERSLGEGSEIETETAIESNIDNNALSKVGDTKRSSSSNCQETVEEMLVTSTIEDKDLEVSNEKEIIESKLQDAIGDSKPKESSGEAENATADNDSLRTEESPEIVAENSTTCKLLEEIEDVLNKSDEIKQKHMFEQEDEGSIPTLTEEFESEKLTQKSDLETEKNEDAQAGAGDNKNAENSKPTSSAILNSLKSGENEEQCDLDVKKIGGEETISISSKNEERKHEFDVEDNKTEVDSSNESQQKNETEVEESVNKDQQITNTEGACSHGTSEENKDNEVISLIHDDNSDNKETQPEEEQNPESVTHIGGQKSEEALDIKDDYVSSNNLLEYVKTSETPKRGSRRLSNAIDYSDDRKEILDTTKAVDVVSNEAVLTPRRSTRRKSTSVEPQSITLQTPANRMIETDMQSELTPRRSSTRKSVDTGATEKNFLSFTPKRNTRRASMSAERTTTPTTTGKKIRRASLSAVPCEAPLTPKRITRRRSSISLDLDDAVKVIQEGNLCNEGAIGIMCEEINENMGAIIEEEEETEELFKPAVEEVGELTTTTTSNSNVATIADGEDLNFVKEKDTLKFVMEENVCEVVDESPAVPEGKQDVGIEDESSEGRDSIAVPQQDVDNILELHQEADATNKTVNESVKDLAKAKQDVEHSEHYVKQDQDNIPKDSNINKEVPIFGDVSTLDLTQDEENSAVSVQDFTQDDNLSAVNANVSVQDLMQTEKSILVASALRDQTQKGNDSANSEHEGVCNVDVNESLQVLALDDKIACESAKDSSGVKKADSIQSTQEEDDAAEEEMETLEVSEDESNYDYGKEVYENEAPLTPKPRKSVRIREDCPKTPALAGIRELLKTPKPEQNTPMVGSIRHLVRSPKLKPQETEEEEAEKLQSVQAMVLTPCRAGSSKLPSKDTPCYKGTGELIQTSKIIKDLLDTPTKEHEKPSQGLKEDEDELPAKSRSIEKTEETSYTCSTSDLGGVKHILDTATQEKEESQDAEDINDGNVELPSDVGTDLRGIKKLASTPNTCATPRFKGMRELLQTPKTTSTPDVAGTEELLVTPAHVIVGRSEDGDIDDIATSSEASKDLGDVKELSKTSKASAAGPCFEVMGKLLQMPKVTSTPILGDIKELLDTSVQDVMQTTENLEEPAITSQHRKEVVVLDSKETASEEGTKNPAIDHDVMKTPKGCSTPQFKGMRELLKTPKVCSTPALCGVKKLMSTPKQDSDNMDKFLKTPTAKNIMIPTLPSSVIIEKSEDSVEMVHSTEYDLNITHGDSSANLGELFKTPIASRFVDRLSASYSNNDEGGEECEDIEKSVQVLPTNNEATADIATPLRKNFQRKSLVLKTPGSPFSAADVLTDLPEPDVEEWMDNIDPLEQSIHLHEEDNGDGEVEEVEINKSNNKIEVIRLDESENNETCKLHESLSVVPETCSKIDCASNFSETMINVSTVRNTTSKDPLAGSTAGKLNRKEKRPITPNEVADISGINLLDETAESILEGCLIVSDDEEENNVDSNKTTQNTTLCENVVNELSEPLLLSDDDEHIETNIKVVQEEAGNEVLQEKDTSIDNLEQSVSEESSNVADKQIKIQEYEIPEDEPECETTISETKEKSMPTSYTEDIAQQDSQNQNKPESTSSKCQTECGDIFLDESAMEDEGNIASDKHIVGPDTNINEYKSEESKQVEEQSINSQPGESKQVERTIAEQFNKASQEVCSLKECEDIFMDDSLSEISDSQKGTTETKSVSETRTESERQKTESSDDEAETVTGDTNSDGDRPQIETTVDTKLLTDDQVVSGSLCESSECNDSKIDQQTKVDVANDTIVKVNESIPSLSQDEGKLEAITEVISIDDTGKDSDKTQRESIIGTENAVESSVCEDNNIEDVVEYADNIVCEEKNNKLITPSSQNGEKPVATTEFIYLDDTNNDSDKPHTAATASDTEQIINNQVAFKSQCEPSECDIQINDKSESDVANYATKTNESRLLLSQDELNPETTTEFISPDDAYKDNNESPCESSELEVIKNDKLLEAEKVIDFVSKTRNESILPSSQEEEQIETIAEVISAGSTNTDIDENQTETPNDTELIIKDQVIPEISCGLSKHESTKNTDQAETEAANEDINEKSNESLSLSSQDGGRLENFSPDDTIKNDNKPETETPSVEQIAKDPSVSESSCETFECEVLTVDDQSDDIISISESTSSEEVMQKKKAAQHSSKFDKNENNDIISLDDSTSCEEVPQYIDEVKAVDTEQESMETNENNELDVPTEENNAKKSSGTVIPSEEEEPSQIEEPSQVEEPSQERKNDSTNSVDDVHKVKDGAIIAETAGHISTFQGTRELHETEASFSKEKSIKDPKQMPGSESSATEEEEVIPEVIIESKLCEAEQLNIDNENILESTPSEIEERIPTFVESKETGGEAATESDDKVFEDESKESDFTAEEIVVPTKSEIKTNLPPTLNETKDIGAEVVEWTEYRAAADESKKHDAFAEETLVPTKSEIESRALPTLNKPKDIEEKKRMQLESEKPFLVKESKEIVTETSKEEVIFNVPSEEHQSGNEIENSYGNQAILDIPQSETASEAVALNQKEKCNKEIVAIAPSEMREKSNEGMATIESKLSQAFEEAGEKANKTEIDNSSDPNINLQQIGFSEDGATKSNEMPTQTTEVDKPETFEIKSENIPLKLKSVEESNSSEEKPHSSKIVAGTIKSYDIQVQIRDVPRSESDRPTTRRRVRKGSQSSNCSNESDSDLPKPRRRRKNTKTEDESTECEANVELQPVIECEEDKKEDVETVPDKVEEVMETAPIKEATQSGLLPQNDDIRGSHTNLEVEDQSVKTPVDIGVLSEQVKEKETENTAKISKAQVKRTRRKPSEKERDLTEVCEADVTEKESFKTQTVTEAEDAESEAMKAEQPAKRSRRKPSHIECTSDKTIYINKTKDVNVIDASNDDETLKTVNMAPHDNDESQVSRNEVTEIKSPSSKEVNEKAEIVTNTEGKESAKRTRRKESQAETIADETKATKEADIIDKTAGTTAVTQVIAEETEAASKIREKLMEEVDAIDKKSNEEAPKTADTISSQDTKESERTISEAGEASIVETPSGESEISSDVKVKRVEMTPETDKKKEPARRTRRKPSRADTITKETKSTIDSHINDKASAEALAIEKAEVSSNKSEELNSEKESKTNAIIGGNKTVDEADVIDKKSDQETLQAVETTSAKTAVKIQSEVVKENELEVSQKVGKEESDKSTSRKPRYAERTTDETCETLKTDAVCVNEEVVENPANDIAILIKEESREAEVTEESIQHSCRRTSQDIKYGKGIRKRAFSKSEEETGLDTIEEDDETTPKLSTGQEEYLKSIESSDTSQDTEIVTVKTLKSVEETKPAIKRRCRKAVTDPANDFDNLQHSRRGGRRKFENVEVLDKIEEKENAEDATSIESTEVQVLEKPNAENENMAEDNEVDFGGVSEGAKKHYESGQKRSRRKGSQDAADEGDAMQTRKASRRKAHLEANALHGLDKIRETRETDDGSEGKTQKQIEEISENTLVARTPPKSEEQSKSEKAKGELSRRGGRRKAYIAEKSERYEINIDHPKIADNLTIKGEENLSAEAKSSIQTRGEEENEESAKAAITSKQHKVTEKATEVTEATVEEHETAVKRTRRKAIHGTPNEDISNKHSTRTRRNVKESEHPMVEEESAGSSSKSKNQKLAIEEIDAFNEEPIFVQKVAETASGSLHTEKDEFTKIEVSEEATSTNKKLTTSGERAEEKDSNKDDIKLPKRCTKRTHALSESIHYSPIDGEPAKRRPRQRNQPTLHNQITNEDDVQQNAKDELEKEDIILDAKQKDEHNDSHPVLETRTTDEHDDKQRKAPIRRKAAVVQSSEQERHDEKQPLRSRRGRQVHHAEEPGHSEVQHPDDDKSSSRSRRGLKLPYDEATGNEDDHDNADQHDHDEKASTRTRRGRKAHNDGEIHEETIEKIHPADQHDHKEMSSTRTRRGRKAHDDEEMHHHDDDEAAEEGDHPADHQEKSTTRTRRGRKGHVNEEHRHEDDNTEDQQGHDKKTSGRGRTNHKASELKGDDHHNDIPDNQNDEHGGKASPRSRKIPRRGHDSEIPATKGDESGDHHIHDEVKPTRKRAAAIYEEGVSAIRGRGASRKRGNHEEEHEHNISQEDNTTFDAPHIEPETHEEVKKGNGRRKKTKSKEEPSMVPEESSDHKISSRSPQIEQRSRRRKESHTDHEDQEQQSLVLKSHTRTDSQTSHDTGIQKDGPPTTSEESPSQKRGRDIPQRRAATVHHSYDETSDSDKPEKRKKKSESPRKSVEAAKPIQLETVRSEAPLTHSPALTLSATTARGRTRKPTARVQQFLEEERAKSEYPKKRGLSAGTVDTPSRGRPLKRGAKPVDSEAQMVSTPQTSKRVRGKAAPLPEDFESHEETHTATPPTPTASKGRKVARKAKTDDETEDPAAKKPSAELEAEKEKFSPPKSDDSTPARVAGRRNAAAAAKVRIEEDALAAAAVDAPKKSRGRKPLVKPAAATTTPEKRDHRLPSVPTVDQEEETLKQHASLAKEEAKTVNKRAARKFAVAASNDTDSPAVPTKKSRKGKTATETQTHGSDSEPETATPTNRTTTRGGRKIIHSDSGDQNAASASASNKSAAEETSATTTKRATRARRK